MENKKVTLSGILSLRSKGKGLQVQGFTLVELIVVITILAILGTIAFISLQGYSKDARDSVRISDMSKIKTTLELFQLDAGKYPETTDPTNITYSGAIAWTQGTFGETTYSNVSKLDKIPTDPVTDRKYVYSVINTKQEYQIAGVMEGDEVTINTNQPHPSPLLRGEGIDGILKTNAAQKTAMLKISGNYNGKVLKVSTGSIDYVLAVPSIITSSGFTVEQIVAGKTLAYNGYKNLPAQYAGSSYDLLGDDGLYFVNNDYLVVFSGSLKTLSSSEAAGITARKNLIIKLKSAYSGTAITGIGEIAQIINTSTEDETETEFLGTTIVSNNLGGSITATSGGTGNIGGSEQTPTNSCNSTQPTNAVLTTGTPTSQNQARQNVNSANPCYYTCSSGYGWNGTSCVLASTCGENGTTEITLPNGQTWSCMNLGATTVWDGTTQPTNCGGTSTTNCNSTLTWLGNYYQRGRNEPVNTTTTVSTYSGTFTGLLGHNNFVLGESSYRDWWQNEAGSISPTRWTGINPQGPCSIGRHVPSQTDWQNACNIISGTSCANNLTTINAIKGTLRLPVAGRRLWSSGYYTGQSSDANYWSSNPSPNSNYSYSMYFGTNGINSTNNDSRALGISVRCLKN